MSVILKTPTELMFETARKAKTLRLRDNLSQSGLAERSGVSLGSLKRFEKTGQISFESLLKIALSLNCLSDFNALFTERTFPISLFSRPADHKNRQRGHLK